MGSHRIFYIAMIIVVATMALIQIGAYYYLQRSNNTASSSSQPCNSPATNDTSTNRVDVSTVIGFGNGTASWYNHTLVPSDWNAYELTLYVTDCRIQNAFDPLLNEHLITSILGVGQQGSRSWSLWTFCQSGNAWAYSRVGVDLIPVSRGLILGWAYGISSSGTNPQPPIPTERSIESCP